MAVRDWCFVALASLALAGCGGSGATTTSSSPTGVTAPAATSAPSPSPAPAKTSGLSYSFQDLTITLPDGWKVNKDLENEGVDVTVGKPCYKTYDGENSYCRSFSMLGPVQLKTAYEGRQWTPEDPVHPGSDVSPCILDAQSRFEGVWRQVTSVPKFVKVGSHTAYYREWRQTCRPLPRAPAGTSSAPAAEGAAPVITQRIWWLPKSQILIYDEFSIPELAGVLANATWS